MSTCSSVAKCCRPTLILFIRNLAFSLKRKFSRFWIVNVFSSITQHQSKELKIHISWTNCADKKTTLKDSLSLSLSNLSDHKYETLNLVMTYTRAHTHTHLHRPAVVGVHLLYLLVIAVCVAHSTILYTSIHIMHLNIFLFWILIIYEQFTCFAPIRLSNALENICTAHTTHVAINETDESVSVDFLSVWAN